MQFLLIAKENEKAMETAREHDMIDSFALFLGKNGTRAEYMEIARYYEDRKKLEKAAEFFERVSVRVNVPRPYALHPPTI